MRVRSLTDAEQQALTSGLRSSDAFLMRRCQFLHDAPHALSAAEAEIPTVGAGAHNSATAWLAPCGAVGLLSTIAA